MSASSKKKLRKEQNAARLTEKQRKEQAEARKLKVTSLIFIIIMAVVVVTAVTVMAIQGVQNSGILEKNTTVATIGEHKINAVEANYYYTDLVTSTYNEMYSAYGDSTEAFMSLQGLDITLPLDEQYYFDGEKTWADYYLESALDQAKSDYVLYDAAMAEDFVLPEEDQANIDSISSTMTLYASFSGYSDVDDYLAAMYGPGSSLKTYVQYAERSAIASAYYTDTYERLTYTDEEIREYEKDIYNNYSAYSYASYYLNASNFLPGDLEGTATEEQLATAQEDAKKAAESLTSATTVEELDAAIAALEINAENTSAASSKYDNTLYTSVASSIRDWVADPARQENDIDVIPMESTTTAEDGTETTSISGYYVVLFQGSDNNERPMSNVRHLLVEFECSETEEHDHTEYTDEEKAAAKAEAEGYLETWRAGDKTQESFIELVKAHSDDSSASEGGLFEDINPSSSYVENFLNWSIDPSRKEGDTEVIETEYGYHVMYYVGASKLSYRDSLIITDMKTEAQEAWVNALLDAVTLTIESTSRVNLNRTMSAY